MLPEPFYRDGDRAAVYHADFRQYAEALPEYDGVLADPPYAETSHAWDRWPEGWPAAARARLARGGSLWCCGSFRMFWKRRDEFKLWSVAQEVIWEKQNGSNMMNDRFKRVHEMVVQFWPRDVKWADVYKQVQYTPTAEKQRVKRQQKPAHWSGIGENLYETEVGGPKMVTSILRVRSMQGRGFVNGDGARNDTQKPFDLLEPLLRYSVPPGGLVLVPFCGSGSEMALALRLGYRAIGFDVREAQCKLTTERIRGREGSLLEGVEPLSMSKAEVLARLEKGPPPLAAAFETSGWEEEAEVQGGDGEGRDREEEKDEEPQRQQQQPVQGGLF